MTPPNGGTLKLDSSQETFEGTAPYQLEVRPPVPALTQWAYSLVVQGMDPSVPFTATLLDPTTGEQVVSDEADDGIASIEAELRERTYKLHIEAQQSLSFRAICTQTYGYRE